LRGALDRSHGFGKPASAALLEHGRPSNAKRNEPYGWQRDATNPQPGASEQPVETVRNRADGTWLAVGTAGPNRTVSSDSARGSGRAPGMSAKGNKRTNPMRGRNHRITGNRLRLGVRCLHRLRCGVLRGFRLELERFEEDIKNTEVDPTSLSGAGRRERDTLEGPAGDGQGRGGRGKGQTTRYWTQRRGKC